MYVNCLLMSSLFEILCSLISAWDKVWGVFYQKAWKWCSWDNPPSILGDETCRWMVGQAYKASPLCVHLIHFVHLTCENVCAYACMLAHAHTQRAGIHRSINIRKGPDTTMSNSVITWAFCISRCIYIIWFFSSSSGVIY